MRKLPVEIILSPGWWHRHYGVSFEQPFYLDLETRIHNDRLMRQALYDRFGLGEKAPDPDPRPVIGSLYVAGGFVLPALFGVQIQFKPDEAPWPVCANLTRAEIMALQPPDLASTWPMNGLQRDLAVLEERFGFALGDFDTDGIFNTALHLRGQQLFIDLVEDPGLVDHLFGVLVRTYIDVVRWLRRATGSSAIATNRSILHAGPSIYLHSNCSVSMISPKVYRRRLLPYEKMLADALGPYGIHHCGDNLEKFAPAYAEIPLAFVDVGWGSDVAACCQAFPGAFVNLRLSPVQMRADPPEAIRATIERLLDEAAGHPRLGLCCINMDPDTPDSNIETLLSYGLSA